MTQVPPPRYRIVERGRRLEVIDTWQGGHRPMPSAPTPARSAVPITARPRTLTVGRQDRPARALAPPRPGTAAHGSEIFTTSAWYDASGPRPIVLGAEAQMRLKGLRAIAAVACAMAVFAAIFFWPFFLLGAVFALVRIGAIRRAVATYLDKINQPAAAEASASEG